MLEHYSDVIMSPTVSQITGVSIVYSTVCSGVDQRNHQSSASLAFVRGSHRSPVNSPHKVTVTRKMFHLVTSSWIEKILRSVNNFKWTRILSFHATVNKLRYDNVRLTRVVHNGWAYLGRHYHILTCIKWQISYRQHFPLDFLERKFCMSMQISLKF